jgi:hypothetical protein
MTSVYLWFWRRLRIHYVDLCNRIVWLLIVSLCVKLRIVFTLPWIRTFQHYKYKMNVIDNYC